jgi:hypothetical protein
MLDKLARRLLQPVNTSVVSIMGIFNTLLGFWLVLPMKSLNKYDGQALEVGIGSVTLIIGIFILWGAISERIPVLIIGSMTGAIFWVMASGLAITTNWRATDWIFTFMIATYHGFVGLNMIVNNRNLPNKK